MMLTRPYFSIRFNRFPQSCLISLTKNFLYSSDKSRHCPRNGKSTPAFSQLCFNTFISIFPHVTMVGLHLFSYSASFSTSSGNEIPLSTTSCLIPKNFLHRSVKDGKVFGLTWAEYVSSTLQPKPKRVLPQ